MFGNKKKLILISLAFMICLQAFSQIIDSKICTGPNPIIITKYTSILKTNTQLQFDSILSDEYQKQFTSLEDKPVIFAGYAPFYFWFRFIIKNNDSASKKLFFLLGPTGMRDAELFQGSNGRYSSLGKTGNQYPFIKRPYQYMHYGYPITLPPNSLDTFYLSIDENHDYKSYGFVLMDPKALQVYENKVYFDFGIIVGLLMLFLVLNVYLFFSLKEKIHLWYALYIALLILVVMKNDQLDEQFLGFDSEKAYRLTSILSIASFAIAALMHVVQLFLKNISPNTLIYKLTEIVKWNLLAGGITQLLVFYLEPSYQIEAIVFHWVDKSAVVGVLFILISCIYSFIKGFKEALFILIGQLVFLTGALQRLLLVSTVSYMFPPSVFHVGMIMETMIISFGLIYRYRVDRSEKLRLQLELQEEKISQGVHLIMTQEEERKRIAQDLHDQLGSSLAAVKIRLENLEDGSNLSPLQRSQIINMIDQATNDTRRIAHNLMPPEFTNSTLSELLVSFFKQINIAAKLRFNFIVSGEQTVFSKQEELFIYRIILELVHNIINHAGASEASVQLIYYSDHLEIMVEDNGIGFDAPTTDGIGLKNVQSRVSYLHGFMNIDSNRHGTTIVINIPINRKK